MALARHPMFSEDRNHLGDLLVLPLVLYIEKGKRHASRSRGCEEWSVGGQPIGHHQLVFDRVLTYSRVIGHLASKVAPTYACACVYIGSSLLESRMMGIKGLSSLFYSHRSFPDIPVVRSTSARACQAVVKPRDIEAAAKYTAANLLCIETGMWERISHNGCCSLIH
jgi:hypothetical protein